MTEPKKVALITGAAGGIGRATARILGELGYALMLSDIEAGGLRKLQDELHAADIANASFPGDLNSETYRESLIAETIARFGRIDVLLNNAAWRIAGSLRTLDLATWEKTIGVCLTAPVFLGKAAAAEMEKQQIPGVIINVSSIMAERPSGMAAAYIACKGALESLTKEMAITYGRSGIRVLCVAPGFIRTELSNDYKNQNGENVSDQLIAQLTDFIPLGRGGDAAEVGRTIAWLCSDAASYITGTTITVDGGFQPNFNPYSIKKIQFPEEF
ncbi:SDR family NAD(P)-dependent oxidoreductase [Dyadobacter aurulentus]|uniref:SDR family NAD(P)-dependent oxidoreductase n=1 Tax=Dyadobacter sp. UC 10 TaxID=2605428 RepID=UPI0011F37C33|nr:SDR family oxidoreductase [Dyadobacter sp. UC 10]KAA0988819.1 SDR family oxidoreductase [Dyadobacter sp. UC 10]